MTPLSVTVPGSTVTVQLNKMKLREADMLTMLRHNTRIDAGLTKMGLRSIVNDGIPPTMMRVRELFPDVSSEELVDHWESAMLQYQLENAKLFDVVYETIDLASDWEMIDIEHIQSNFISGEKRDGNGLLRWIRSFHDLNSDALQTKLRAELASFKLPGEITRDRLLKTLLDMLSVWCKIAGNVKSNHVSLMSYYATVRDKIASTPAEKVMPRLRAMLADLMYHRADVLRDPTRLIEQMVQFAAVHDMPKSHATPARAAYPIGSKPGDFATPDRTCNCTICEVFGCTAQGNPQKCATFNPRIDITARPPMQKRFIKGGRDYIKLHPTTTSLKGVRLDLPPFEGSGQGGGKARGGRATSQGGRGRGMAAPVFTVQNMLGDSNTTTTQGANECTFEQWVAEQNGDLVLHKNDIVVPLMDGLGLANLFSQEPADEQLTQQELLDAISAQTAEQLLKFQTPQVSRREENPALVTITPRPGSGVTTPVPNTSLNLLRASAAAESGGGRIREER